MALKDIWTDKIDEVNDVLAKDINDVAHSVIANEGQVASHTKQIDDLKTSVSAQIEKINEKANISDVDLLQKRVDNLEGATLKTTLDETVAQSKIVPADAQKYALVNKLGGMTHKSRNAFKPTYGDRDVTIGEDGVIRFPMPLFDGEAYESTYAQHIIHLDTSVLKPNATYTLKVIAPQTHDDYGFVFITEAFIDLLLEGEDGYSIEMDGTTTLPANVQDYEAYLNIKVDSGYEGWAGDIDFIMACDLYDVNESHLGYEPHFEGLRNAETTELVSKSPNLLKITSVPDDAVLNADGSVTITVPAVGEYYFDSLQVSCELPPNKTYVFQSFANYPNGVSDGSLGIDYYPIVAGADEGSSVTAFDGASFSTVPLVNSRVNVVSGFLANDSDTPQEVTIAFMVHEGTTPLPNYIPPRDEPIDTFPISEALRDFLADKGYGKGVSAEYHNYIDFERKKFAQNAYEVDLGELDWLVHGTSRFVATLPKANKATNSYNKKADAICSLYDIQTQNKVYANTIGIATSSNGVNVYVYDNRYTDVEAFKQAMSGVKFCYALAKPDEYDISKYLDDDNFIEVEGGSVIEAVNEYDYAVPSSIGYIYKL